MFHIYNKWKCVHHPEHIKLDQYLLDRCYLQLNIDNTFMVFNGTNVCYGIFIINIITDDQYQITFTRLRSSKKIVNDDASAVLLADVMNTLTDRTHNFTLTLNNLIFHESEGNFVFGVDNYGNDAVNLNQCSIL